MTRTRKLWIPLYLFACLLLGGASNGGFLANGLLQLMGVVLIVWACWKPADSPIKEGAQPLIWLIATGMLVVLLQFLPLPQAVWEMSVGRAGLVEEAASIGIVYMPMLWTLVPYESLKSAVWLLPAIAVATALLRSPDWKPQHLAWAIVAAMVLSCILGAAQLSQGQDSSAYLYAITNRGSTVGFFANSNHLATLLLVSIPFIAASAGMRFKDRQGRYNSSVALICTGLLIVALTGIAVNGSLAGFALATPVLAASTMTLVEGARVRRAGLVILPLFLLGGLAWLLLSETGAQLLAFEEMQSSAGGRQVIWKTTAEAIRDYMPFGSGLGTFAEVYRRYENPAQVADFYINHAHNDYLELLLELGLSMVPVFLIFLAWWMRNVARIWLSSAANPFAFAGAISSGTILIHSFVDYPLRTAAMSSIFAASLCLMILPSRRQGSAASFVAAE